MAENVTRIPVKIQEKDCQRSVNDASVGTVL